MEVAQEFCLKWNNYQSTLHRFFHRLWSNGTFVDVSLIVEGRRIDCHRVMLSACSTYFEQLLRDHAAHPHPLILLHDIPYSAVASLVAFMYSGEINVSHDQLTALLKVADTLKIKGLADSEAISNFTKYRLMSPDITKITTSTQLPYRSNFAFAAPVATQPHIGVNGLNNNSGGFAFARGSPQFFSQINGKWQESPTSHSPKPPKKRCRQEEPNSTLLPPSPVSPRGESQNSEAPPASPQDNSNNQDVKTEPEEETDTELQIDESVGQSTSESTESDPHSNQNTPGLDTDSRESDERHETAKSLAALATQGTYHIMEQQHQHIMIPRVSTGMVKQEKNSNAPKNGERTYTMRDLEEGIESVLLGHLTPAKAIAKYKVPRRTFFRRLSAVRKSRGIPSSKENSSEHYLNSGQSHSPVPSANEKKTAQIPLIIPGIMSNDSTFITNLTKVANKTNSDSAGLKKEKKVSSVMTSGNVFSLLNVAANPNYEYYLKYLKLQGQSQSKESSAAEKTGPAVDDNSNLATSETPANEGALALVTQNGSVK